MRYYGSAGWEGQGSFGGIVEAVWIGLGRKGREKLRNFLVDDHDKRALGHQKGSYRGA